MKFKIYILTIVSVISCFYLNGQESQSEKWSRLNVKEVISTDSDSSYQFIDILDSNGNYHISIYEESNFVDSAFHFYFPNGTLKKIIGINYNSEDNSLYIDSTLITFYYYENGSLQKEEKVESEFHSLKVYKKGTDDYTDTIFIYDNLNNPQLGKSNLTTYDDSLRLKTVVLREYEGDKILIEKSNNLNNQNDFITSYQYQKNRISQKTTNFGKLDSDFEIKKLTLKNEDLYNYKNQRLIKITRLTENFDDKDPIVLTTKFEYNEFGLVTREILIKENNVVLEKYYSYTYFK